jgi:hypothetical protein
MKTLPLFVFALVSLMALPVMAQAPVPVGSAHQALTAAQAAVDPSLQNQIVSVYGTGLPAGIKDWYVIFYDPSVASHGRVVLVENGQVVRTYEANGGVVYSDTLTFHADQVNDEGAALAATQNYAGQHGIAYDHVRALLRLTTKDPSFRWRIEMMDGPANKGFVFVNTTDGAFAMYKSAGTEPATSSGTGGGVIGDAKKAGNDVKNTFLGIGGDLQEFFTGERTVDQ